MGTDVAASRNPRYHNNDDEHDHEDPETAKVLLGRAQTCNIVQLVITPEQSVNNSTKTMLPQAASGQSPPRDSYSNNTKGHIWEAIVAEYMEK